MINLNRSIRRLHTFRPNRACNVLDSYIAYVEREGSQASKTAVVFLHGNPSSSFLWRNIAKEVEQDAPQYRLLCPDLIGQGRSGESSKGYDFFAHYGYLEKWFDQVVNKSDQDVVLCVHDWGSALGFHWARKNSSRVKGIVHMESIIGPLASWDEFPSIGRKAFMSMRETPTGETMVLEKNFFVERLLLGEKWAAGLDQESLAVYRERWHSPSTRKPTLEWPRQIPIKGTNSSKEMIEAAEAWESFLQHSAIPKLFIPADPGFFTARILEKTKSWKNHQVASPAIKGMHFIQEDNPKQISSFLLDFLRKL